MGPGTRLKILGMPTITKILVPNRGEIAVRIFRACKEMGIKTVAMYSRIDSNAFHVSFADEAYFGGETPPSESYLNISNILDIARRSGSDAIHPGYGFLAENAEFATAVQDAGLVWIGPPPRALEAAGDKISARAMASLAGVASVPGTSRPVDGPKAIGEFAARYGWPVAIKASKGGGGRGFRVVSQAHEVEPAFESAAREALVSFGDRDLYLERYLESPRHIEVQVLGDSHGNLVHLGERDCSLQRRHQKLIEESPAPAIDPEIRQSMGEAAVKVARAAGYSSAGTVEFLFEFTNEGPTFWFLEMNTRLQVEHPVTELVTGKDLVHQMIRIAEGEPLAFDQSEVTLRGHAIECRINAENPAEGFLPQPGEVVSHREPAGPGVRVDAGAGPGSFIPPNYDSLISKLVCYGESRQVAIRRTLRALDEYEITGLTTTIPFHRQVLASKWFAEGTFSTRTVEQDLDLSALPVERTTRPPSGHRERMVSVELEGRRYELLFTHASDPELLRTKPSPPDISSAHVHAGMGETITAPMQGTIVKLLVEDGAAVRSGEAIMVLEAMKMENQIVSHSDGWVRFRVGQGQTVSVGTLIAVIETG
jgi:acetyl-CoA/propionyl-CoA carboxylase biotin carboxyl carrier protein